MPQHSSSRVVGVRYETDSRPGIRRRRSGSGFRYIAPTGEPLRDQREVERIRSLVIPPAWTDVWLNPNPRGHIQATARDAKGRKQYRYHPRWRAAREADKYARLIAFGEALPGIRARVAEELGRSGLSRDKVLAAVVRLLETTCIRIGNREYARTNRSYGLTTLRDRHAEITGSTVRFRFRGKSGKEHAVTLRDRRLAAVVRRCRDLPGRDLFQYIDEEGKRRTVRSRDVNGWLRAVTGSDFTAKDFRTWAASVRALSLLSAAQPATRETKSKRTINAAIRGVADRLGNTAAVCRKSYIHPAVIESFAGGGLPAVEFDTSAAAGDLDCHEAALLALLRRRRSETVHGRG